MNREELKRELFERLDVPEYASTQQRINLINRMVRDKMKIEKRRLTVVKRRVILVAAIVAVGALSIAASYFKASDAFRGFLKEQDAQGEAAELSSTAPIVDKTGVLLELAEPVESGGIRVTPTAIAGDDSTFAILFQLETTDGSPLGLLQADGSYSGDTIMFGMPTITANGIDPDRLMTQGRETKVDGAKGTILQRFDLYKPVPMGETIHVELDGLRQKAVMQGQETGLAGQSFYDAVTGFGTTADALQTISDSHFTGMSGAGFDPEQYLREDSGKSVPLSGALEGYTLTNALVHEGVLYMRGTAPLKARVSDVMRPAALVADDGRTLDTTILRWGQRDRTANPWVMMVEGVQSAEDLKDLSWLVGHGESFYDRAKGNWEFDIALKYEIITREEKPGKPMAINGQSGTLQTVSISPYKLRFDFLPDDLRADTMNAIGETYNEGEVDVTLKMKDGSVVVPRVQDQIVVYERPDDETSPVKKIEVFYTLEEVIDPTQVEAFHYEQYTYPLG